jgi:hypothetical protein
LTTQTRDASHNDAFDVERPAGELSGGIPPSNQAQKAIKDVCMTALASTLGVGRSQVVVNSMTFTASRRRLLVAATVEMDISIKAEQLAGDWAPLGSTRLISS